jgi:hypothetical protein
MLEQGILTCRDPRSILMSGEMVFDPTLILRCIVTLTVHDWGLVNSDATVCCFRLFPSKGTPRSCWIIAEAPALTRGKELLEYSRALDTTPFPEDGCSWVLYLPLSEFRFAGSSAGGGRQIDWWVGQSLPWHAREQYRVLQIEIVQTTQLACLYW